MPIISWRKVAVMWEQSVGKGERGGVEGGGGEAKGGKEG